MINHTPVGRLARGDIVRYGQRLTNKTVASVVGEMFPSGRVKGFRVSWDGGGSTLYGPQAYVTVLSQD